MPDNIKLDFDNELFDTYICPNCKIIDKNWERSRDGHLCSTCNKPGVGGLKYFVISTHTIVDLIIEAYKSKHEIHYEGTPVEYTINTHYISVLIFFCTLREILLHSLIRELCEINKIPPGIYDRLQSDNKTYSQKQNKLFPSLTGVKWSEAIESLNKKEYIVLNKTVKDLVGYRNKFLHEAGKVFEIDKSIADKCIKNIPLLLNLFIDLHNKYVHEIHFSKF